MQEHIKNQVDELISRLSKERDFDLKEITNHVCIDDESIAEKWVQTQDHTYHATRVGTLNEVIRDLKEIIK